MNTLSTLTSLIYALGLITAIRHFRIYHNKVSSATAVSISSAGISVSMKPGAPYLFLPNSTCVAIAKYLLVINKSGKALYIWNTTDSQYRKIVTSPTYLGFVFRGSNGNLTINAPFRLFNLSLQPLLRLKECLTCLANRLKTQGATTR